MKRISMCVGLLVSCSLYAAGIATADALALVAATNPNNVLAPGGGIIVYVYTVSNPDPSPVSHISVHDNACGKISGPFGDINNNNALDTGEQWVYTCYAYVPVSTVGTVTVTGMSNTTFLNISAFTSVLVASAKDPSRLRIPKINIDIPLEPVGIMSDGKLGVPQNLAGAGWFDFGPFPGELGSSVIDGHFGSFHGQAAVFNNLSQLVPGDMVYVDYGAARTVAFKVSNTSSIGKDDASSGIFISNDGRAHLNLITCDGVWEKTKLSYSKRLVVFTDLLSTPR